MKNAVIITQKALSWAKEAWNAEWSGKGSVYRVVWLGLYVWLTQTCAQKQRPFLFFFLRMKHSCCFKYLQSRLNTGFLGCNQVIKITTHARIHIIYIHYIYVYIYLYISTHMHILAFFPRFARSMPKRFPRSRSWREKITHGARMGFELLPSNGFFFFL